jgi:hypothetical protein
VVPEASPDIVTGELTIPVPKLVHVTPLLVVHSYDEIAAPPLLPAVKVNRNEVVVGTCDTMVGALAATAEISNDCDTSTATK